MSYEQIFRKQIDLKILYDLFDNISVSKNGLHAVDVNVYKKMVFHNMHVEFCDKLKEYYHKSKQFYATRPFTYKSFTTILRQICKYNNVDIVSKVRYVDSEYSNEYVIHLPIIA
jgi:hypothetical protein